LSNYVGSRIKSSVTQNEGPPAGKQKSLELGDDDFCFQLKGISPKIAFVFLKKNDKSRSPYVTLTSFLAVATPTSQGLGGEGGAVSQVLEG
jgi:hypothetical protein